MLQRSTVLAVCGMLLAGTARAAASSGADRAARLLGATFDGAAGEGFPAFEQAPAAATPSSQKTSLFPETLWSGLAAPDASTTSWLKKRIPGLDSGQVHELPFSEADKILGAAVKLGYYGFDLFTDDGLLEPHLYYLSRATLVQLFGKYELKTVTEIDGKTTDGQTFEMQALVVGGGKLEFLYSQDDFHYKSRFFDDTFVSSSRVTETILQPGALGVSGVKVEFDAWIKKVHPVLQRFVKLPASQCADLDPSKPCSRVDTNYGSRLKPISPIKLNK